ncbi:response regulator [Paenibacillus sp. NPDC058174]|uniref:response regulator n=1 Tax=Paenibacillus sp. NPDC058174 TaxID=3346366 RepID=UPI0036DD69E3
MRALLVDDEEHALNILELFIEKIGGVEVVGRANNAPEALESMRTTKPDVVFLDIEMPGMNGVELAEVINNEFTNVHIVFVTAYDRYAVSAFEQEALDYILKPLEIERLARTINRISKKLGKIAPMAAQTTADSASPPLPKLHIRLFGGFEVTNENGQRLKVRTAKEKELLAYLAAHAESRSHRDVFLEHLWSKEHYRKAKGYLHTCVSYLRRNIKSFGLEDVVLYDDQRYYLNLNRVTVDVHTFQHQLAAMKQQPQTTPNEWSELLELYRGPMLEGEDYLWAKQSVEELDHTVEKCRLSLVKAYLDHGHAERAIELAERICLQSPYNEESYRLRMQGLQTMGKHDEAYHVYRLLEQSLEELQIEPSELTKSLFNNLKRIERK